jgi:hypothetical protein
LGAFYLPKAQHLDLLIADDIAETSIYRGSGSKFISALTCLAEMLDKPMQ